MFTCCWCYGGLYKSEALSMLCPLTLLSAYIPFFRRYTKAVQPLNLIVVGDPEPQRASEPSTSSVLNCESKKQGYSNVQNHLGIHNCTYLHNISHKCPWSMTKVPLALSSGPESIKTTVLVQPDLDMKAMMFEMRSERWDISRPSSKENKSSDPFESITGVIDIQ